MELDTLSCSLGNWGTGMEPAEVTPSWLEDVSEASSNFNHCPTWVAARWA